MKEYQVIAEEMIGRPLREGEIVHHRNGDHEDNRPDNLLVVTEEEHNTLHGKYTWRRSDLPITGEGAYVIRTVRELMGIKQYELAEALGYKSSAQVSQMETSDKPMDFAMLAFVVATLVDMYRERAQALQPLLRRVARACIDDQLLLTDAVDLCNQLSDLRVDRII